MSDSRSKLRMDAAVDPVAMAFRVEAAEAERDAYKAALAELVRLKDHPLHDTFVEEKCAAWDLARSVLAGESSTTEE